MGRSLESFLSKFEKGEDGECWDWLAGRMGSYGSFWNGERKTYAHRQSYVVYFGGIPDGMWVLHSCDNPLCVNPKHLFLGTSDDNIRDKVSKGRQAKGERNGTAKLCHKDVERIRGGEFSGMKQKEIASMFGVSQSAISLVIRGKNW